MTRDSDGNIVEQCDATYKKDYTVVHCTKEKGHDGGHADARGDWTEATEADAVPTAQE